MLVNGVPLETLIPQVSIAARPTFARAVLVQAYPGLVQVFDALTSEQRARAILFLSLVPHSREARLAEAARIAGWIPFLVSINQPRFEASRHFGVIQIVHDQLMMILVQWLFPGPLAHVFTPFGDQASPFIFYKQQPVVLDAYDYCSGFTNEAPQRHQLERWCIANADAVIHRDLRIRYLTKIHGYEKPRRSLFLLDPLWRLPPGVAASNGQRTPGEIHVVNVGWVGTGDASMLRVFQLLCAHQIHVHAHFNLNQYEGHPDTVGYYELQRASPHFHIENSFYGDDYWKMLTGYDFGLSVADVDAFGEPLTTMMHDSLLGCGSSRVMDYIAAGLGVIQSPGLRFQHFISKRYAPVAVSVNREFIDNPRLQIERALRMRSEQGRKNIDLISMEHSGTKLSEFYDQVIRASGNQHATVIVEERAQTW